MKHNVFTCDICHRRVESLNWHDGSIPIVIKPFDADGLNGIFGMSKDGYDKEDHCADCRAAIVHAVKEVVKLRGTI